MDKKNILPQQGKPVFRTTTGKLPSHLAELSEEALSGGAEASSSTVCICAYDGAEASSSTVCICAYDDAE
ncbi:MAG: microcyclamide/patellamide family RiPP [Coleofasciculus sp. D1-CHI-01]